MPSMVCPWMTPVCTRTQPFAAHSTFFSKVARTVASGHSSAPAIAVRYPLHDVMLAPYAFPPRLPVSRRGRSSDRTQPEATVVLPASVLIANCCPWSASTDHPVPADASVGGSYTSGSYLGAG